MRTERQIAGLGSHTAKRSPQLVKRQRAQRQRKSQTVRHSAPIDTRAALNSEVEREARIAAGSLQSVKQRGLCIFKALRSATAPGRTRNCKARIILHG